MFYQALIVEDSPCAYIRELSVFPLHWHNEIEIVYCLEGSFTVTINGISYAVTTGQTVFVGSAELHEYTGGTSETKILVIEIGEVLLKKNFQNLVKRTFINPVMDNKPGKIQTLFDKILAELKQSDIVCKEWIINSCLFELAAFIFRELPSIPDISNQRFERIRAMQRVSKALEYLHTNYKNKITVEEAAQFTGYKKSKFFKHFKKATQMTFHQYLNMFRISRACTLLSSGDEPITAVAKETGFPVPKTFCRVFKEVMNMTPTEYRKLYNS